MLLYECSGHRNTFVFRNIARSASNGFLVEPMFSPDAFVRVNFLDVVLQIAPISGMLNLPNLDGFIGTIALDFLFIVDFGNDRYVVTHSVVQG